MNKALLVLFWICIGFHAIAQQRENSNFIFWPYNQYTENIDFTESVYLPETSTDTLYSVAKSFCLNTFKGERDTVVQDDDLKTLVCKSAYVIPVEELGERGLGYIRFTLTVQCKYKYYKYSLTNLEHFAMNPDGVTGGHLENEKTASGGMLFPRTYWERQKTKCYNMIQATIAQLKLAMNSLAES